MQAAKEEKQLIVLPVCDTYDPQEWAVWQYWKVQ